MPTSEDDPIDLLTTPVFTVATEDERIELSLAGLLARLGRGEATELAYLMPHQQHVMHALIVQLAALVCARSGNARLDRDEGEWREALRALAGCDEAFHLVVADLSKPAFMQPPVPDGALDKWSAIDTPDALDILLTAKNHDVKAQRLRAPRLEHWVYALVSLQTQQGYSGRDNHGIARMNGGFGNRPGLGVAPSLDLAARFGRDARALLAAREQLLSETRPYRADGIALVWLEPWDGARSLSVEKLDPFFIEICRRIRLRRDGEHVRAWARPTKAPRLEAKELKGNTGDAWTPVEVERGTALTLGGGGFEYGKLSELLFGDDWLRPSALEVRPEDGAAPLAIARAIVRGQGKTEGLHDRVVPVPEKARSLFASREGRSRLGALAQARIEAAKSLRLRVLKPALCALLQGGADDLRFDDDRADSLLEDVDRSIDAEFFPRLFEDIAERPEEQRARFERWLLELGKQALARGIDRLPVPVARRERAIAAAEGRFFGGARKNLPSAFQTTEPAKESA
ncbi:MAG: type I-E CRISPR-associated protein Cse1/CasA [Sandaracinaceae bacterium]|nr:type I-E CRISPR-associated protein Cse1/CasA [Sandaracinaceae bacterium]